jgi:N-formylmaleamate deformylase
MEGSSFMNTFMYGGNVHANGIRQHYLRYGRAEAGQENRGAIIIVPGITSPAVTWGFVGQRFGLHHDTYILDVRGRGLSEASDDLDYSVDAQGADVLAFAKVLGLKRFAIVGHSMGGRIAVRAARMRPEGLARLVLIDPPVSGPGRRPYPSKLPWYLDSMRMARQGMDKEGMRAFCPTWTDEQLHLRSEWLHTCNERAVVTSFEEFHTGDFHDDLPQVAVPTMLMVAGRGDVIRPEDIEEIQKLLPSVEVSHVPDAGHMIPWDDEEGFYSAFGSFLGAPLTKNIVAKDIANLA